MRYIKDELKKAGLKGVKSLGQQDYIFNEHGSFKRESFKVPKRFIIEVNNLISNQDRLLPETELEWTEEGNFFIIDVTIQLGD